MADNIIKFGTSGWRAVIGEDFTFENVRLVTRAIAHYLKQTAKTGPRTIRVIVGYDTRFMSEGFALECAGVLAGEGIQPMLTEEDTPTPVISYEILRRKRDGAINFTASHNPYEYNGMKFSPSYGGPAFPEITDRIEKEISRLSRIKISQKPIHRAGIEVRYIDPGEPYISRIKEIVDLKALRKLKIIADPLYGTGRHYLQRILEDTGCRFKILHNWRDVCFGGGRPEPDRESLKELVAEVRAGRAHMGIATDGDADRFGIVDDRGTYYAPNSVITLLLYYLHKTRGWKNPVVRTVATTHMIDALARRYGIEVIETPVGFKYIAEVMQRQDITIGGEESGGLTIHRHIPEKDGILACLLMAEMVAVEKKRIAEILNNLYRQVGVFLSKRINLGLTPQTEKNLRSSLKKSIRDIAGLKVKDKLAIDGTKFILEDGSWILFRFSGTEPLVRIYAESDTRKKLDVLLEAGRKMAERNGG